jgi:DNA-binding beta-propeller fold protein YncE
MIQANPGRRRLLDLWPGCAGALLLFSGAAAGHGAGVWEQRLEQDGVRTHMRLESADGAALSPGASVRLRVTMTSALDGSPIARSLPGVWIDSVGAQQAQAEPADRCRQRIGRYVRANSLNPQALTDLNGYDVLALNADASISVLDPRTQFAGKTSLRASIGLPGTGFDWASTPDDTRLFVSVPARSSLAVADLITLRTTAQVALAGSPGRVRMHPGGKDVWVGVASGQDGRSGGLAIVPVDPPHQPAWLPLGQGHVDMAFDPAGWTAVTQRNEAQVVFVDPATRRVAHSERLAAQAMPLAVVFDTASRRFLVADAWSGQVLAFDHRGQPQPGLTLSPGIGPMSISPDGRWLFVANPGAHAVHVVDLSGWRVAHRLPVSGRPFDVVHTADYAYVRALDTEAITLVSLASLSDTPRLQTIGMGERPPGRTPHLPIASQMVPMPDGSGSFVASPGDNAVYFYMEGMNAAAGSVSARGHELRAVRLARRGLREVAPGVFEQQFSLPEVQHLMLAVATDAPRTQHCLPLSLAQPAGQPLPGWQLAWEELPEQSNRLVLRLSGAPGPQAPQRLSIRLFQPGSGTWDVLAEATGQGRYVATVPLLAAGLWYAHPQPPVASSVRWPYVSFTRKGAGS